jgi:putative aldouronate transport system permease protein
MRRSKVKTSAYEKAFDIFIYLFLTFIAIATLYPFLNVLAISLNDSTDALRGGINIWPRIFTTKNYNEVFNYQNIPVAFRNSVLRTVIGTALGLVITAMVAYTISRKDFIARKFVSTLFLITMYISGGLIPGYMLIRSLNLMGTFWVYIIPMLISPFNLFLIRSYIDGIPDSLTESAMIDGANDLTIFFKVIFPLLKPVLATVGLMIAVGHWNSWFDVYLYSLNKPNLSTLQFELQKVLQNAAASASAAANTNPELAGDIVYPQTIRMTITVVASLPIIIVYPFIQKYFVQGLTMGAVKG